MNSSKQLIRIDLFVLSDYSLRNKCLFPSNSHAIHTFDELMVHYTEKPVLSGHLKIDKTMA